MIALGYLLTFGWVFLTVGLTLVLTGALSIINALMTSMLELHFIARNN